MKELRDFFQAPSVPVFVSHLPSDISCEAAACEDNHTSVLNNYPHNI